MNTLLMDDPIFEMFNFNPMDNIMDPYDYFKEYDEFDIISYLKEEGENTPKKGLLRKLIDFIIKGIDKIVRVIQKAITWIKEKIFGTKQPRSVDQILNDIGISRSDSAKDPNRTIPWDDNSDPNAIPKNISMMTKPLLIEFEHDSETVTITSMDYILNNIFKKRQGSITNDHSGAMHDPRAFITVMKFIKSPELMKELEFIAKTIADGRIDHNTYIRIDRIFNQSITTPNLIPKYKLKLKEFQDFNIHMLNIQKILQTIDDTRNDVGDNNKDVVKALNMLNTAILNIQIGSTLIGSCLRRVYIIDPNYCETIRDSNILDQFVNKMIESGIPDKYVAFNAWMASDIPIKGNEDVDKPKWGMARVTFLPPDKSIVYKIAINGWGIRSNNSEKIVSEAVYDAGLGERFAKIIECGPTTSVVTMERVEVDSSRVTTSVVSEVKNALTDAINKAGIPGKIGDVGKTNIGFRGDVAVSFDYGMITRTSTMPQS